MGIRRSLMIAMAGMLILSHAGSAQRAQSPARQASPGPQGPRVDLLIRGGTVVDGTGAAPRAADVGLVRDRITFIGDAAASGVTAARTIDARGLIVAPGFVDPHTHTAADLSSVARKSNLPYLMQGVTTVVTNNDGDGPVDIAVQLAQWTKSGIGTNAAVYVGEGSVRAAVMGQAAAPPTAAQLEQMRAAVDRGMKAGAIGLSTGLYYAPGSYATTDEVITLARAAAEHGGLYDSHLRDESSHTISLIGAVSEAIRIGREAHLPVHISPIESLGAGVFGQADTVIALIRHARADGADVTADQYPYTASGSTVGAPVDMKDADIDRFMVQDFVSTGSDGSDGHPRKYGTFPRLFREYVYNRHLLTVQQAVRRSSAFTAQTLGFQDRGTLKRGYYADVIVFDPNTIADKSTYEQPTLLATGMKYVIVNGVLAIDDERYTGAAAGRVLHRTQTIRVIEK